ncbi:MAG: hypothetical protein ACLSAH_04955 [Bilophila wadsworthia]
MGMLLSVEGYGNRSGGGGVAGTPIWTWRKVRSWPCLDNGAGKSTFVRLLSGAGRPDGGTFGLGESR